MKSNSFRIFLGVLILVLLSAVILFYLKASPREPDISISGAEAVISPVMIGSVSVFMDISNGGAGDELISARTSVPKSVVILHEELEGQMVQTDRIPIPSRGSMVLRPFGPHIMLFNMPRTLKEGDSITLYLTFAKSGERQVQAKVAASYHRQ